MSCSDYKLPDAENYDLIAQGEADHSTITGATTSGCDDPLWRNTTMAETAYEGDLNTKGHLFGSTGSSNRQYEEKPKLAKQNPLSWKNNYSFVQSRGRYGRLKRLR